MFESIIYKQPLPICQCTLKYLFTKMQKSSDSFKKTKDFLVFLLKNYK